MLNPIKEIVKWQRDAGNAAKPYVDFLESSFQIEEALEGFTDLPELAKVLSRSDKITVKSESPKDLSRAIIALASTECDDISNVERLDKACDAIIFAIGSMAKLGLDHHAITKALNIVNDANKAKLGMSRDSEGKLLKPDNWEKYSPEPLLQKLLDTCRK